MKFHEYRTLWEETRKQLPRDVTEELFYAASLAGGARTGNGLVLAEVIWNRHRRPYYQLYPAIVPALLHLRLDLDACLIRTPMPALAIRLSADKPIDELLGVQTALMCQDRPGSELRLWVNFMRPTGLANMHITLGCEPGKTLEQSFQESAANTQSYIVSGNFYSDEYLPLVQNCLRLSAMLCLLADDPEVITPIPEAIPTTPLRHHGEHDEARASLRPLALDQRQARPCDRVELVGGASDGKVVTAEFSLDVEQTRDLFDHIALELRRFSRPHGGPRLVIEGIYLERDVVVTILPHAPEDEEPGMKLDVSRARRRRLN